MIQIKQNKQKARTYLFIEIIKVLRIFIVIFLFNSVINYSASAQITVYDSGDAPITSTSICNSSQISISISLTEVKSGGFYSYYFSNGTGNKITLTLPSALSFGNDSDNQITEISSPANISNINYSYYDQKIEITFKHTYNGVVDVLTFDNILIDVSASINDNMYLNFEHNFITVNNYPDTDYLYSEGDDDILTLTSTAPTLSFVETSYCYGTGTATGSTSVTLSHTSDANCSYAGLELYIKPSCRCNFR